MNMAVPIGFFLGVSLFCLSACLFAWLGDHRRLLRNGYCCRRGRDCARRRHHRRRVRSIRSGSGTYTRRQTRYARQMKKGAA